MSTVPGMRRVAGVLLAALPGMASIRRVAALAVHAVPNHDRRRLGERCAGTEPPPAETRAPAELETVRQELAAVNAKLDQLLMRESASPAAQPGTTSQAQLS
ncbi:hypothetical protein ACBJ59_50230 [Nonomuraea sp. MTCD27]|uniref:hypothetical protein n=1 Tax=Nonomuraea sp. MTCD27 TaxID=1676747 RepID=UPI0035C0ED6B